MSLIFATQFSAVATAVLAVLAIATAVFAFLAFRKQSQEVRAIEQQVTDAEELTRQQAELLRVQSGQLELQRDQLADQLEANARQADILELQAAELSASIEQRKRNVEEVRRRQAAMVTAWFAKEARGSFAVWGAVIRNASELPSMCACPSTTSKRSGRVVIGSPCSAVLRQKRFASSRRSQTAFTNSPSKSGQ